MLLAARTAEFLLGALIACLTLADVFSSIIVPGRAESWLRVAVRVRTLSLPAFRRVSRRAGGARSRLTNSLAPFLMATSFLVWMLLLLIAFGLMMHALQSLFTPGLADLSEATYVAGSSLLTLGVSEVDAHGVARWLILVAGLAGFGVITATITFILQVQSALDRRESVVLALAGMTGRPPSGVALLESVAALDLRDELPALFREWRDWSAATLHSHGAYPVLAYFHSVDAESDWLAVLGAVLDAATLVMALIEPGERTTAHGSASLLHRAGSRTAAHLCDLFDITPDPVPEPDPADLDALRERLGRAGYALRQGHAATDRLARLREDYAGRLSALTAHVGTGSAPLRPRRQDGQGQDAQGPNADRQPSDSEHESTGAPV